MSLLQSLESFSLLQNSGKQYAIAFGVFLVALIVIKIFQQVILARLRNFSAKTENNYDNALINTCNSIRLSFYIAAALLVSFQFLTVHEEVRKWLNIILGIIIVFDITKAIGNLVRLMAEAHIAKKQDQENIAHTKLIVNLVRGTIMISIWTIVVLLILSNIGFNVTSMIAGLGIGGIAIALAAQNILGDLFSSLSILVDKPFQVGDYIIIGEHKGTVKKIGLKTTRIKTPRGEELVVSNKELTDARIQNLKKLETRRKTFEFSIAYGYSQTQLKKIPRLIKEVIQKVEGVKFERSCLKELAESGLVFEASYVVESPEFKTYATKRQQIVLGVYTQLMKEGIEFAYPTRVIKVENVEE